MKVLSLFPSLMHMYAVKEFAKIKDKLIQFAYQEKEKDPKGKVISGLGGWQSNDHYANYANPISSTINIILGNMLTNTKIFKVNKKLVVSGMWININRPGDSNTKHIHASCDLSGILWIKQPNKGGNIQFESPHAFSHYNQANAYTSDFLQSYCNGPAMEIVPLEGNILIFPSSTYHMVLPNCSKEDRISASFNMEISLE